MGNRPLAHKAMLIIIIRGSLSKLMSSWSLARVKGICELRAKSHFASIGGIRGIHGIRQIVLRGHCPEFDVLFCQKPIVRPWAGQVDFHGNLSRLRVVQQLPTATQREPKTINESKLSYPQIKNYLHLNDKYTNSRSTAIQRPASTNTHPYQY